MFVYLLMLWTFGMPPSAPRISKGKSTACSALPFAMHPIQTELVTYIINPTEACDVLLYASFHQEVKNSLSCGATLTAVLAMGPMNGR
jgi:hypothetical protein